MRVPTGQALVLSLGAGVVVAVASPVLLLWLMFQTPEPHPPIADGLPPAFSAAEHAFVARVRTAFPTGSSERDLVAGLEAQGFQQRNLDDRRRLFLTRSRSSCRLDWTVDWRVDRHGTITEIEPGYHGDCL